MSRRYDEYIDKHKENVLKAFRWLEENDILKDFSREEIQTALYFCEYVHDQSKYEEEEYDAYDQYFYGSRSYQVVEDFNYAWLHHIHNNPHHWQYWVLINDNPNEGEIILDMPDRFIIEMVCDWMSFGIGKDNIGEIFEWYHEHGPYMKLSENTRKKVDDILGKIKERLSED